MPDGLPNYARAITVQSLGRTVTYDPDALFAALRSTYGFACEDVSTHELNVRVVRQLYSELGHSIDRATAGGVVDLVYAGQHVCTIVLNAYLARI